MYKSSTTYIRLLMRFHTRGRAAALCVYAYYKAGLAGQWPVFRVLSAIGRRMARQRWPMAEDPLDSSLTLVLTL